MHGVTTTALQPFRVSFVDDDRVAFAGQVAHAVAVLGRRLGPVPFLDQRLVEFLLDLGWRLAFELAWVVTVGFGRARVRLLRLARAP